MTRRRLRPEEVELWRKVADTAQRLHPERTAHETPHPKPKPAKQPKTRMSDFTLGQSAQPMGRSHDLAPSLRDAMDRAPVAMDRKTFTRMKKGKLTPEARIDLHGMTLDRAHSALMRFILTQHSKGRRLALVITGKGRDRDGDGPIPVRRGVLKHQVPQWLSTPPLAQAVLQVVPAHASHGGDGAYYVYLRRHR
ncbi:Smr/MutS family protein [Lutimaribacter sp. EGI FJ00015]|uniref:Smr/MutS family protein n=1 Tax=Lutimaribacter degradans TaxID=2945989 RepID=A0ACC5ZUX5_9RHOB|nr:Smr/MutS family protein [Lutimaribacter sp. EGI FJ00013]MCM2561985.1 Smr/MutS family protein [Lutimaribacter sp. EGI FJ00013]MCO0612983.1 Smr/MutS family protein [Lutimaribacter sp. EGI FJ00015]MCO0635817.1 Smr/MutS family protein [Lutimaribacter sp. EGI FJ00014]